MRLRRQLTKEPRWLTRRVRRSPAASPGAMPVRHAAREEPERYSSRRTPQSASKTANTRRLLLRGSSGVKKSPAAIPVELTRVPDELLAVPEPHAHLAGVGGPRPGRGPSTRRARVAVEAPDEEHRLELRQRDLEALGIRLPERDEAKAGLLRIEIGVPLQNPAVGIPDDDAAGAPADPEPPPRRSRSAPVSERHTIDTVTPCGHADFTVSGDPVGRHGIHAASRSQPCPRRSRLRQPRHAEALARRSPRKPGRRARVRGPRGPG